MAPKQAVSGLVLSALVLGLEQGIAELRRGRRRAVSPRQLDARHSLVAADEASVIGIPPPPLRSRTAAPAASGASGRRACAVAPPGSIGLSTPAARTTLRAACWAPSAGAGCFSASSSCRALDGSQSHRTRCAAAAPPRPPPSGPCAGSRPARPSPSSARAAAACSASSVAARRRRQSNRRRRVQAGPRGSRSRTSGERLHNQARAKPVPGPPVRRCAAAVGAAAGRGSSAGRGAVARPSRAISGGDAPAIQALQLFEEEPPGAATAHFRPWRRAGSTCAGARPQQRPLGAAGQPCRGSRRARSRTILWRQWQPSDLCKPPCARPHRCAQPGPGANGERDRCHPSSPRHRRPRAANGAPPLPLRLLARLMTHCGPAAR